MSELSSRTLCALLLCFSALLAAGEASDAEIEALIGRLAEIQAYGVGYNGSRAGSQFLPLGGTDRAGAMLLGQPAPVESATLKSLVELGARAVPALLKHLDDARPLKTPPVAGLMWTSFESEYDTNGRTSPQPEDTGRGKQPDIRADTHALSVGDLCFVALGQIANRNFNASRYQPSGGVVVNSPRLNPTLLKAARAEFADFNVEKHRARLLADFSNPDHEWRLQGAYQRLAYYFPGELEPLLHKALALPAYDVFAIHDFVRKSLYKETNLEKRKTLVKGFLADRGPEWREGLLKNLFSDLDTQIADEEGRVSPKLKEKYRARDVLVESFGYTPQVKSSEQPPETYWNSSERARFIASLVHDRIRSVDDAIAKELAKVRDDDYLALACMRRLIGRGYDTLIVEYCLRRKDVSEHDKDELKEMLEFVRKHPSKTEPQ